MLPAGHFAKEDIEAIYQAYPRRQGKLTALEKVEKALGIIEEDETLPGDPVEWLLNRVKAYAKSRIGCDKQFTPLPATWLNQGRYYDDDAEVASGSRIKVPPGKYSKVRIQTSAPASERSNSADSQGD